MYFIRMLSITLILSGFLGCSSVTSNSESPSSDDPADQSEWLLPDDEVINGGVSKDGIPSVDEPKFKPTSEIDYVQDERLIVGVRIGNTIKGYPHQVLDFHEIINDQIGNQPVCVTYCPLTGSGIAWDRTINGEAVEFGVSGLLFRNNLIPYDRKTDTYYSQMLMQGVRGDRAGTKLETFQVIETTWSTWKQMFPNAQVLSRDTGFGNLGYQGYLYGEDYLDEDSPPLFPISAEEKALGGRGYKERVFGIIDSDEGILDTQNFVIDDFGNGVNLKQTSTRHADYIVVGSASLNFAVAFERELSDGSEPNFQPVQNSLPVILTDDDGNQWDVFGYAVEGPRKGERLTPAVAFTSYWFAWGEFFLWGRF